MYRVVKNKPTFSSNKAGAKIESPPRCKYSIYYRDSCICDIKDYQPNRRGIAYGIVTLLNNQSKIDLNINGE